jgi:hypothetical protein
LTDAYISLGDSNVAKLEPGQWMKAVVDKDVSANVRFRISSANKNKIEVYKNDKILTGNYGSLLNADRWLSGLFEVFRGDSVTVAVRDKIE